MHNNANTGTMWLGINNANTGTMWVGISMHMLVICLFMFFFFNVCDMLMHCRGQIQFMVSDASGSGSALAMTKMVSILRGISDREFSC